MEIIRTWRSLCFIVLCACVGSVYAAEGAPVNINTADAATLATALKGVGDAKAEAIVAWREQHGPFKAAAQLAEVRGIGDALVEANRDRIVVE